MAGEGQEPAVKCAEERGCHFVPSFHADLVKGVSAATEPDTVQSGQGVLG